MNQGKNLNKGEEKGGFMSKMNVPFLKVSFEILFSKLLLKSLHLSALTFQFSSLLWSNEIVLVRICSSSEVQMFNIIWFKNSSISALYLVNCN